MIKLSINSTKDTQTFTSKTKAINFIKMKGLKPNEYTLVDTKNDTVHEQGIWLTKEERDKIRDGMTHRDIKLLRRTNNKRTSKATNTKDPEQKIYKIVDKTEESRTTMSEAEIIKLANTLIDEHLTNHEDNQFDWSFEFINSKRTLGRCSINKFRNIGIIALSKHMIDNERSIIEETLYHEISHGIDFIETGDSSHGDRWQNTMKQFGYAPKRLASSEKYAKFIKDVNFKYTGSCPSCGAAINLTRMSSRAKLMMDRYYYCTKCSSPSNRVYIKFVQNY